MENNTIKREPVEEFLEMLESDYEHLKPNSEAARIIKNYITDLKEILESE